MCEGYSHSARKGITMTKFSTLARACQTYFSGSPAVALGVALSDKSETEMARCGETSAAILHCKLSGLYYS